MKVTDNAEPIEDEEPRDGNGMTRKEREALLVKTHPERAFLPKDWRTQKTWKYGSHEKMERRRERSGQ